MKREIKFRAWDKVNNKMMSAMRFTPDFMNESTAHIIMQYTGLKDKNGVEIYEGDIVQIKEDCKEYGFNAGEIGNIVFEDYYVGISLKSQEKPGARSTFMADVNNGKDVVVIGNIHENPELLNS